jgi:hypothetical protein
VTDTRSNSERIRLEHIIKRMRGTLDALESALSQPGVPFGDTGVSATCNEIVTCLARHDAYLMAEKDQAKLPPTDE